MKDHLFWLLMAFLRGFAMAAGALLAYGLLWPHLPQFI